MNFTVFFVILVQFSTEIELRDREKFQSKFCKQVTSRTEKVGHFEDTKGIFFSKVKIFGVLIEGLDDHGQF